MGFGDFGLSVKRPQVLNASLDCGCARGALGAHLLDTVLFAMSEVGL